MEQAKTIPIDCADSAALVESGTQSQGVGSTTVHTDQELPAADADKVFLVREVCKRQEYKDIQSRIQ